MKRFSPQHLPYAMPAVLLLFFFGVCPTLFLCLYPTRLFRKCFKVHPKVQLLSKTFADAFQCCYKDGLNGNYDFRILSSAPMVFSITIFTIINFFYNIQDFNVEVSSRSNSLISFAVAYVRPFKSLYMNFSFSFHFIIGCLLQEIAVMEYESQFPSHYLAVSYTILSLLPHVFALATIVYQLLHHIRCVRTVFTIMSEKISVILCRAPDGTESLPDRLQNSYAYRTLPPIL